MVDDTCVKGWPHARLCSSISIVCIYVFILLCSIMMLVKDKYAKEYDLCPFFEREKYLATKRYLIADNC